MRTAPVPVTTFLASNNVVWRADLITITPLGASPLRWTSADASILSGGNTFLANGAFLRRSKFRNALLPEIDVMEVELAGWFTLADGRTVAKAALDGYFRGAAFNLDHMLMPTPGDTSLGAIPALFSGAVAEVSPGAQVTTLRVTSVADQLAGTVLPRNTYQRACCYVLYDAGTCKVVRASYTVSGTVTGVPTKTSLTANGLAQATGYFDGGVISFNGNVTGALAGVKRGVRAFTSGSPATLTPTVAFPIAPAAGDTFTVYPGCDRSQATCTAKFANAANFRGFPYTPKSGA